MAWDYARQTIALYEASGDRYNASVMRANMATERRHRGQLDEAEADLRHAIDMCREFGNPANEPTWLSQLATVHMVRGDLDMSAIDEIAWVDDEMTDATARRLYREEALMVGPSAAAIASGALRYLAEDGREGVAVAIAPDSGQKAATYLNEILGG